MKVIVTHASPDLDAITSVWLIKRFLPGWENAQVQFVPAGERLARTPTSSAGPAAHSSQGARASLSFGTERTARLGSPPLASPADIANSRLASGQATIVSSPIEKIGEDEVIHVDTGLGPLDHHQTPNDKVCAASLTWDYIKQVQSSKFNPSASLRARVQNEESERVKDQQEAIERMVRVVIEIDHFKEVFWENPLADYHEFSLLEILDGLKLQKPNQDNYYVDFCIECLDAILHDFENRIWAEKEIAQNGKKFTTRFGQGIGFETLNDSVIKLAQKMGYVLVVRKDPRKGYTRIKARPKDEKQNIDLTLAYEKLKKMDPQATWFLHISKKMLLNGTAKNPKMVPTRLSLDEIMRVLEKI